MIVKLFLTCSYNRTTYLSNGSGKEGTMCTAFSYCRFHQQRLRGFGTYAPKSSGSFGFGPWALRPKRLQWLTNIGTGFKIAAFRVLLMFRVSTMTAVNPAQAGVQLRSGFSERKQDASFRWHDGMKGGNSHSKNTSRALPHFFSSEFWSGAKLRQKHSPPSFSIGGAMS